MFIKDNHLELILELLAAYAYISFFKALTDLPNQKQYFEKMINPEIGDIVLDISHIKTKKIIKRIGRLLSIEDEPYPDWDGVKPAQTREILKIRTFDEREITWINPSFIAIQKDHIDVIEREYSAKH